MRSETGQENKLGSVKQNFTLHLKYFIILKRVPTFSNKFVYHHWVTCRLFRQMIPTLLFAMLCIIIGTDSNI